ncbi:MAG TPA: SGNH/GDSL hydrolase family protein [Aeromicrobium sp.]|mgnify:CR=1 FL=1|nr:SGNH/GDSL hydrolase family protein [Aeromicrobium sp.]
MARGRSLTRRASMALATPVVAVLVASTAVSPPSAPQDPVELSKLSFTSTQNTPAQTMMVIGDSYSSYYGDLTTRYPGWWAYLAADLNLEPVVRAQPGTGFVASGRSCELTKFAERMSAIRLANPKILVIAGGRNDWRTCTASGRLAPATRTQIKHETDAYFRILATVWSDMGRSASDVYVLSPWGSSMSKKGSVIRPIIRDSAVASGFNWIRTEPLVRANTVDGIHPNQSGNLQLSEQVLTNSDLRARFAAGAN